MVHELSMHGSRKPTLGTHARAIARPAPCCARMGRRTASGVAPQEVDREDGWFGQARIGDGRRCARLPASTPDSLVHVTSTPMPNYFYHLHYAISKRTPPSPRVWQAIAESQERLNRCLKWTNERLSLAPVRPADRPQFTFPLIHLGLSKQTPPDPRIAQVDAGPVVRIDDAYAVGSTKVRDSLWDAHVVAAFLRRVSADHPELLLELRDEGGFVLPGAVWIKAGKVQLNRDWLNRERERVLEMTGDPNAAASYLWAEAEALQGRFFAETAASDFAEVPEIEDLGASWDELQSMSLAEVADAVVSRVIANAAVPARV